MSGQGTIARLRSVGRRANPGHVMNTSPTTVSFRGAHFAAANTIPIPDKTRAPLTVNLRFIIAVASLVDALARVLALHTARFAIATHGAIESVRTRIEWVAELVASGEEVCRRLQAGLAQLQPNRVVPVGDKKSIRTGSH